MGVGMSWLDLKLGVRMLVKYPGLTVIGVLAISVAIGIGTAYFEFVNDFLHPALPLEDGKRVVAILNWDVEANSPELRSLHDYLTWRAELESVEDLGAFTTLERNLITEDGQAEPVAVAEISASAFRLVRVPPLMGRPLVEADEQEGAPPVVVIGYGVWQTRFGGDPAVVGRTVQLGNSTSTIVGVMPEGFAFPVRHGLWVPLRVNVADYQRLEGPTIRTFARLAPGVTLGEAQAQLTTIGLRAAADFPDTNEYLRPRIMPYVKSFFADAMWWEEYLMGSVFVMLLVVACANVATLMFARTAAREREIVVRNALGATRGRIIVQLCIEALVLVSVAALVGLAAAHWGMRWGWNLVWSEEGNVRPFWWTDDMSPATLLYVAMFVGLGAAIVGIIPALRVTERGVQAGLQRGRVAGSNVRFGGLWTAVIVTQIALTVAFLPTAISEAWAEIREQTAGAAFPAEEYLSVRLEMDGNIQPTPSAETSEAEFVAQFGAAYRELERRLEAEAGVTAVTFADRLPGMSHPRRSIEVDGALPAALPVAPNVRVASVDVNFFTALTVPILSGRPFQSGDLESDRGVVIVNQSFVRQVLGDRNPIGRRVRYATPAGQEPGGWYEIIGVVKDLGMNTDPQGSAVGLYHPTAVGEVHPARVAVRVRGDPESFAPRLRSIAMSVDPALRLYNLVPLEQVRRAEKIGSWIFAAILALMAAIALLLSTAGIYSLMSFTVGQRTREIGIRAAIGAHPRRIVTAIFSRAVKQLGLGVVAGGLGATLLVVAGVGDQITREGPGLLAAVSAVMMFVGLLACAVPARRALRIEPTEALRGDG